MTTTTLPGRTPSRSSSARSGAVDRAITRRQPTATRDSGTGASSSGAGKTATWTGRRGRCVMVASRRDQAALMTGTKGPWVPGPGPGRPGRGGPGSGPNLGAPGEMPRFGTPAAAVACGRSRAGWGRTAGRSALPGPAGTAGRMAAPSMRFGRFGRFRVPMATRASTKDPGWVSLTEACRLLGVSPSTVRRWADTGMVRTFVTPGGHRRFSRAGLESLLPRPAHRPPVPRRPGRDAGPDGPGLPAGDRPRTRARIPWVAELDEARSASGSAPTGAGS